MVKHKKNGSDDDGSLSPSLPKPGPFASLRNNFLTGVVIAAPLFITVAVVYWLITGPLAGLDDFVQKRIPQEWLPAWAQTVSLVPGFGVLVAVIFLILLGMMAKNFIGQFFIKTGERVFHSMPGVRNLYGFFKNVFEMALQQSEQSFKEVALIEYPRPGIWTLCFVVTKTKGEVRHRTTDIAEDMTNVFVPTTPNPTSGFLLFVPRSTLRVLDMTVEDGAKMIFSAGLVAPEFNSPEELAARSSEASKTVGTAARGFGILRKRQVERTVKDEQSSSPLAPGE